MQIVFQVFDASTYQIVKRVPVSLEAEEGRSIKFRRLPVIIDGRLGRYRLQTRLYTAVRGRFGIYHAYKRLVVYKGKRSPVERRGDNERGVLE